MSCQGQTTPRPEEAELNLTFISAVISIEHMESNNSFQKGIKQAPPGKEILLSDAKHQENRGGATALCWWKPAERESEHVILMPPHP